MLRQILTILRKDLRAELRGKEAINASVSFSLVILLLFSFAFDPTADETKQIAGGLLWLVFAFSAAMILNRSFSRELPNDCLDVLIAAPISGGTLFLGKALASYVLLLGVELICIPVFGIFFDVRWTVQVWPLLLVLALGTWAMAVIGTAFGALTINVRLRELMLPLLLYPILIPALLSAMQLTSGIFSGEPLAGANLTWLKMLIAIDVIFTALALALMDIILVV